MNMMVSILTPIYNVEKYIERCAVSLFEQTYENIEYVFVDDCSPDLSIEVLKQVMSRYPNRLSQIKIITHDKNRGVATSRNTAFDNCTGEFVCYVDPDDYLNLNSVELLAKQQSRTDSDIVTGMALMHTTDKEILMPHPHYETKEEMVRDLMQLNGYHSLWKRLIRKSLFQEFGISAKDGVNNGEDCWIMTQLAYYSSSFSFVDEIVYHYDYTREDSISDKGKGKINKKQIQDVITTANLLIDFFKDKEHVYQAVAKQEAVKYLHLTLARAACSNDSKLFGEMLTEIRKYGKQYWAAIGWDNSFKRLMSQNIYSCRAYHLLMIFYYKYQSIKNNPENT